MMYNLPGQRDGRVSTPNDFYLYEMGIIELPMQVIDKNKAYAGKNTGYEYELRAGTLMGIVTSTGKWTPMRRTNVTAGGGATAQAIPVNDASCFMVGDVISVGADTGKTIASINYSTNTITVSDTAFTFANDEAVIVADGSATFRGILASHVIVKDYSNNTVYDRHGRICVGGVINTGRLYGDLAAARADTAPPRLPIIWGDQVGQV